MGEEKACPQVCGHAVLKMQSELFRAASYAAEFETVRKCIPHSDASKELNAVGNGYSFSTPMLVWMLRCAMNPFPNDADEIEFLMKKGGRFNRSLLIDAALESETTIDARDIDKLLFNVVPPRYPPPARDSNLQRDFRRKLLVEQHACVVRGVCHEPAVEAAHIESYSKTHNFSLSNGLILCCSIHKGYDDGFFKFDGKGRLYFHPKYDPDMLRHAYCIPDSFVQLASKLLTQDRVERLNREFVLWKRQLNAEPNLHV